MYNYYNCANISSHIIFIIAKKICDCGLVVKLLYIPFAYNLKYE